MTFKSYYIHCIFLSPRSTSAASLVQRDIKRGLEQKAGEDFKEQKLGYYVMPGIKSQSFDVDRSLEGSVTKASARGRRLRVCFE